MRGVLVGRDRELAALAGYLDDVQQGRPSIVLCRGKPGIGKTRLAEELVGLAGDRGVPSSAWDRRTGVHPIPPHQDRHLGLRKDPR
jgi:ATP-dependent Clp protease ATP-binding subunit ClpA